MAHHKSSIKRIRQDAEKRLRSRFYKKSTRSAMRNFMAITDKSIATAFLPKVVSMIDRLAKHNRIHDNKASNLKSGLMKHLVAMA